MYTVEKVLSLTELEELARWTNFMSGPDQIEMQLPGLTEDENQHYQGEMNRYLAVCGCGEGKALLGLLVAGYVLFLWLRPAGFQGAGWAEFGTGFALACAGAMVGKAFGLMAARRRMNVLLTEVRGKLTPQPA